MEDSSEDESAIFITQSQRSENAAAVALRRSCATRLYEGGVPEQVIVETTGHRSCDGFREYKCTSSTLKRKASEILQGATPKRAEIDVKEKNEKLFNNDVEQKYDGQARLGIPLIISLLPKRTATVFLRQLDLTENEYFLRLKSPI